ncbi:hypothetical protein Droror1_Dr00027330 [Drosera rotundifolia]
MVEQLCARNLAGETNESDLRSIRRTSIWGLALIYTVAAGVQFGSPGSTFYCLPRKKDEPVVLDVKIFRVAVKAALVAVVAHRIEVSVRMGVGFESKAVASLFLPDLLFDSDGEIASSNEKGKLIKVGKGKLLLDHLLSWIGKVHRIGRRGHAPAGGMPSLAGNKKGREVGLLIVEKWGNFWADGKDSLGPILNGLEMEKGKRDFVDWCVFGPV